MKDFRYVSSSDVYLALAIWVDISGMEVMDYRGAVKLVKCAEVEVKDWQVKSINEKKEWLYGFLKWLWVEGKKFSEAWRYVTKYVLDMKVEDGVKEVVDTYKAYVKERFGKDVNVDVTKKEVIKAAKVLRKVAKEMGLSLYDVIKYQHECWEEIREPLVFERMSDESLVKRRIKVKMDEDRKQGVVMKAQGEDKVKKGGETEELEKLVAKYWKDILATGPFLYVGKKGWLAEMAKEYWAKLCRADVPARMRLKTEYSVERIIERWKEAGCPAKLLE
jgi:hypothetical protein